MTAAIRVTTSTIRRRRQDGVTAGRRRTSGRCRDPAVRIPSPETAVRSDAGHKRGYELGFGVVEGKVHVHDLQATVLHLLGFDHERLTYRFQGRDYRLTDVHGNVVHEILA